MAIISWENYVDDSTITNNSALESPVNSTEALTVENLKTRQIGKVFRQTFTAITSPLDELVIDFDLGSAKATDLIGILNHNMGGYAYTISFGTSSGASDVGQETGTLWSGTSYDSPNELLYLASAYTAQYVRIAVAIPAATSVDIGRVWLDSAWSYKNKMDFSLGIIDRSTKTKSRGGSTYVSDRQKLRQLDVRAYGNSNDDFYGDSADSDFKSWLTIDQAVGQSGEVICIPMTANQHERQRTGVYGTISKNNPMRVQDKGADGYIFEKQLTVEEDRG